VGGFDEGLHPPPTESGFSMTTPDNAGNVGENPDDAARNDDSGRPPRNAPAEESGTAPPPAAEGHS
jgi:hypothetical protein